MDPPASADGDGLNSDSTLPDHPKTLLITVFHRERPQQSDLGHGSPNGRESALSLSKIISHIQFPDSENILESHRSIKVHEDVVRNIFKTPAKHDVNYPLFRHQPVVAEFEKEYSVEVVFDSNSRYTPAEGRPLRLALFDMDSTLINEEVIDELARSIGISDAVSAITARAMNGDIDFATSLKERVSMLKGVPTAVWEELKKTVTIAEGARELVAGLKARNVFTGVVSGGFTPMAEWLKGELGLDVAVANHLLGSPPTEQFPFPHLSGQLNPDFPIVTPELKRNTLLQLSAEHTIPLSETMAVGDGSNDLFMLGAAGLGIAWRAKGKVQLAAPMRLNGKSLAELLYLFSPED